MEFRYGCAYYPEVWGLDGLDRDIARMKDLRINFVRMGEFAWASMEPRENEFRFEPFAEAVRRLGENGIGTVFCTPGAAAPAWMTSGHDERLYTDRHGQRSHFGARQHVCSNNPYFRERLALLTKKIAAALADSPYIIGWQIDNEMKSGVGECFCDECEKLWHAYLERRYRMVENLNALWHTELWSEVFTDFSQVPPPRANTYNSASPSLEMAYRQFSHAAAIEFQQMQLDIIRRYSSAPTTHNSSVNHRLNHAENYKIYDFAAFDYYPEDRDFHDWLFACERWRGLKPGVPFWMMETSSGQCGCFHGCQMVHPRGFLTAEAVAAAALGGGGFAYWLFRQTPAGNEMPHSALLSSWGAPSFGYGEAKEIGEILEKLSPRLAAGRVVPADAAVIASDLARTQLYAEPLAWDAPEHPYNRRLMDFTAGLRDAGLRFDVLPEDGDLPGVKLLFTPFMPHISAGLFARAQALVERGGVWVIGPQSGYRTAENTANLDAGLGKGLEDFAGVSCVWMYDAGRRESESGESLGQTVRPGGWSAFFDLQGAESWGRMASGRSSGRHFLTVMPRGKGFAVLLGCNPAGDGAAVWLRVFLDKLCGLAGVARRVCTPGTIVVPREEAPGRRFLLAVNLDGRGGSFADDAGRQRTLKPYGWEIVEA